MYISKKGVVLFLSYAYLVFEFMKHGGHSGFIFLFGILIELIFLLISYALIPLIRKGKVFSGNSFQVLIGAIPIMVINYFIAYHVALKFDGLDVLGSLETQSFYYPILYYKDTITVLIIGFTMAYGMEIFDFIRSKGHISDVAESIVYQGIIFWVMGMLGGVILLFMPGKWVIFTVILFSSARIGLELLLNKWRKKNLEA